jgi:hypothetical protein
VPTSRKIQTLSARVKSRALAEQELKIRSNVKGVGQECPTHTSKWRRFPQIYFFDGQITLLPNLWVGKLDKEGCGTGRQNSRSLTSFGMTGILETGRRGDG